MNATRLHAAYIALLVGCAVGACDAGGPPDGSALESGLPDASDTVTHDAEADGADVLSDAPGADTPVDAPPDDGPDASDIASDTPDEGEDVTTTDTTDIPIDGDSVDSDVAADVPADPCEVCSDSQICVDGACLGGLTNPCDAYNPCGPGLVCGIGGMCAAANAAGEVGMEYLGTPFRDWPEAWTFTYAFRDRVGFGLSAAFAEFDDGALQVLIAATSDGLNNLCRYRIDGHSWVPDAPACSTVSANANTAAWIPPHGGLPSRFVIGGNNRLVLAVDNFEDPPSLFGEDMLADEHLCAAFAIAPIDVDLDGLLDVLVSCHGPSASIGSVQQTLVLRALSDGSFQRMSDRHAAEFRRAAVLLALPGLDINNDGLLDYVYIADTFSNPERRNTRNTPSFVLLRCAPTEECTWRQSPIDPGLEAWGSHMGAGVVQVDTVGPLFAISDWGPRDLRDLTNDPVRDLAVATGFAGGRDAADTEYLYSWSMAIADFDRNGLRDVLVTQATAEIRRLERSVVPDHPDLLLLQQGGGTFETRPEASWLVDAGGAPIAPGLTHYHRGAIVQDFDLDGQLEIYVNQYGHAPVLYEEQASEHPPRCLLRFVPGLIPTIGPGIQTAPTPLGPWDAAVLQGEMRLQAPLRAVVDARDGFVRFPSGAVVPYACGDSVGPHDVVEPDWLRVLYEPDGIHIALDASAWPEPILSIEAALVDVDRTLVEIVPLDDANTFAIAEDLGVDAFMLRINGRWVGRYFAAAGPALPE